MPQNKLKRNVYLDGENQPPGLPGFRTRQGRSGYDPLDTNREAAFMEGTFYRNLFTLRLRTRKAFHLILMFIFGAAISIIMGLALFGIISAPIYGERNVGYYIASVIVYLLWGFILAIGLALLANFFINIRAILGIGKRKIESTSKTKSPRKKFQKRRKDFR